MSFRQHYDTKLEDIRAEVIRMGGKAGDMVHMAVDATLNGDLELAARVIAADDEVDFIELDAVNRTVLTVMQESPVAADLRLLVSTLGVVGEIEKVGDDAVKLARRATKLSGKFPSEMKRALLELGEEARRSFAHAIKLYAEYSPELAAQVIRGDKAIDTQYSTARNRVIELIRSDPDSTEHLVRTIEAFHALEHVADHAVAIAIRLQMLHEGVAMHE